MRGIAFAGFGLGLVLLTGCGPVGPASVSGTVTYDGKPLEGGTIGFYPDRGGAPQFTTIGEGGKFELAPGPEEVQLMAGSYRVSVNGTTAPKVGKGPPGPGRPVTPLRYADKAESGLRCTLNPGSNTLQFDLAREDG